MNKLSDIFTKLLLICLSIMLVLVVYLVLFSNIESITKTTYNSIFHFLSFPDNIVLTVFFLISFLSGIFLLAIIFLNKED